MDYGLRLSDDLGNQSTLVPSDLTIVSAGRVSMPDALNGDNTYGVDINLPGSDIPEDELSVLVVPSRPISGIIYQRFIDETLYYTTSYADDEYTYYERNDDTGVMTLWSAGNKTANERSTWDSILSVFPIAFWDKMGADTFDKIRLFAATGYFLRDMGNVGDDENFSLDGTAAGSGYNAGAPANVKDNDTGTYCGYYLYRNQGDGPPIYASYSFSITVTLARAFNITKVEAYQTLNATKLAGAGSFCRGWWYIDLYDGEWDTKANGSWQAAYSATITSSATGNWTTVTHIRIRGVGEIQTSLFDSWCLLYHYVRELRAWGPGEGDLG
ncbi:MAG TPA: hypothetical protein ENH82_05740, partial [bacterium]|nr:hypothetical protein [bacterium]